MIIITGATGFVGRHIVKRALADGHQVRAIVRELNTETKALARLGVDIFHGNVLYAPSLEGAMDGATCVLHLVGIIHEWKENTFARVHTQATSHVIDATKKAGVHRYIHMSALGARPDAKSLYHQTKWAAEELVRKSGLGWTIFRPSLIYGAGDKSVNVFAKIAQRFPFVPVLGSGKSKVQPIAIEDVATAFVRAIKNDSSIGKNYDLCGPEALTWNALFDYLCDRYKIQKPKLHLPLSIAKIQALLFDKTLQYPPFNSDQLIMATEDNTGDPLPAQRDFILELESFQQGLARNLS